MIEEAGRFYNRLIWVTPDGSLAAYDKRHLFRYAGEQKVYTPGNRRLIVECHGWRIRPFVCYDLRFPELYRELQAQGADGFAVPAAFTARTGRAHWDILVRARAIENLSFVLAAAQSGDHPGARQTYGHSMIVDAWGQVLGWLQQENEGVVLANLDAQGQMLLRQQFPALRHRRRWLDGPQTNEQEET
jgi:nitrilase